MDSGSPVSLDFTFPFSSDTPGVSSGNATVSPSGNHVYPDTPSNVTAFRVRNAHVSGSQHRTSIDSVLDQDVMGEWSPSQENSQTRLSLSHGAGNDSNENAQHEREAEDGPVPTWSELKTKAGKERKRLPLACIACRRKKIKCSGEKPACKHCMRARVPCVYKITTRKAAPRTDYMAMLDKRLKRMEDRVIKMIPKEDLPDLTVTGRSSVRPPLPGQPVKKEKIQNNKRSAEEAFDAEMSDWTQARIPTKPEGGAPQRIQREFENKLVVEGTEALPPNHIQEHLVELFFDCVYGQSYLLLHKPSFMRKLKGGAVPPVLILAVCAVSARFSTHPQVSTEPAFLRGEQWATPARNIIEKRHFEPNVTILTSMVILGLHYFGTCEGGLSWSFGGQAMRLGYALQLHRELDHDPLGRAQAERTAVSGKNTPKLPELSFTDREIRRRLMWACYLMDTFNSSGTERPSFLNEEYIKIQLPIKESKFHLEAPGLTEDLEGHVTIPSDSNISPEQAQAEARANMGVAAYVMRAVVIWKKVVQYLNLGGKEKDAHPIWDPQSQFAALQRQTTQLRSSLPDSLKYNAENLATHVSERLANQFLFLHIILAQNNLFLHRFAIPTAPNVHRPYSPNTPKPFLANCATTVVESASLISKIVADSTGHTFTVPFAGYCAYAAATVHVWGIFSKHPSLEASSKESLRHNYRYLTRMKRYWGMFHYMAESIKDIYRAFADAAAKSHSRSNKGSLTSSQQPTTKPTAINESSTLAVLADAISADPSRAASPIPADNDDDSDSHTVSRLAQSTKNRTKSESSVTTSTTGPGGKLMLQYGDWFDKYPHGVSETEWETSHLPHKKEALKGTEAIMSQQSDLQSVEQFFASLSPPSKGDAGADSVEGGAHAAAATGQRSKKIARRKGKNVFDSLNSGADKGRGEGSSNTKTGRSVSGSGHGPDPQSRLLLTSQSYIHGQQQHQGGGQTLTPSASSILTNDQGVQNLPLDLNTSDIDIPMSEYASQPHPLQSQPGTAFDMSTVGPPRSIYQKPQSQFSATQPQRPSLDFDYNIAINSPSTASVSGPTPTAANAGIDANSHATPSAGNQLNFNFNYTSALPHLDRQMVFGAYAGIDPSTTSNSSALNNPNNLDFWSNPWDNMGTSAIDMDGIEMPDFDDGLAVPGTSTNVDVRGGGMNGGAAGGGGGTGSSAWFMPFNIEPPSFGGFDDYGAFDGMDMGSGNGSFSGPGNLGGET